MALFGRLMFLTQVQLKEKMSDKMFSLTIFDFGILFARGVLPDWPCDSSARRIMLLLLMQLGPTTLLRPFWKD